MADYKRRVELLEDDAFNFLTDVHNISNHQNNYDVYNRTHKYTARQSQGEKGQTPLYTSQNIGSYSKTRSDKKEEIERSNLKIKQEIQIADLNMNRGPLIYTSRVPYCPNSTSDIKEEGYKIPEANTNHGPLFASRVPDYMLESRSELKEEIKEYQPESYEPLYASHVDYPRSKSNVKEEYDIPDVDANYRPLYASCEYPASTPDVTYRPAFEFSTKRLLQSDLGDIHPLGPNMVHISQTSNMAFAPQNATNTGFQEHQRNLAGVSDSLYMPKTSQSTSGLPCATKRPNLTHGTSQLQSNILNTAPTNTAICAEPKLMNVSPQLDSIISNKANTAANTTVRAVEPSAILTHSSPQLYPNMFNRVPNTAPVNTVRTTEPGFNHSHFSPQFQSNNMLNRASNTFVHTREPKPNITHGLLQLNSNMLNRAPNTTVYATGLRPNFTHIPPQSEPNTLKRAPNIVIANTVRAAEPKSNFTHISTQIKPNISNREPNVPVAELKTNRTYSSPILDSYMFIRKPDTPPNTVTRFSELWRHLTHERQKLKSRLSYTKINTGPNTSVPVSESRPNLTSISPQLELNMSSRNVRVSESNCHFSHDPPQLKSNMSNTKINKGPNTAVLVSESKPNLSPILPQLEFNMSNREPSTALNTAVGISESRRHPTHHSSQLKSNTGGTKINTGKVRFSESRVNLTPVSQQLELNMSNREPNKASNSYVRASSWPNSTHGSQLHPIIDPHLPPHVAKASRKDEETREPSNKDGVQLDASAKTTTSKLRKSSSNGNSQSKYCKRDKINFFDWERQLRDAICTPNEHSTQRKNKTTPKVAINLNPVKRTMGRIIKLRYICKICSCIYIRAPIKHLKKQHRVKAKLWKYLYAYIKCRFCFRLIRKKYYKNHIRMVHNKLYYSS